MGSVTHDGFDWETRTDFGPSDEFYFVWSGDQANSIMSYIDVNWDFSQFDRDNMDRFLAAAHVDSANEISADILADPDSDTALDELRAADLLIGRSEAALRDRRYPLASAYAKRAYNLVRSGARAAGVRVVGDDSGTQVDPPRNRQANCYSFVDRIGPRSQRAKP